MSQHSAVYALGSIATKVIGILLVPIYTNSNYLSHSDYGVLAILEATAVLLLGGLTMAMGSSLSRWYLDKDYAGKQKEIFSTSLFFLIAVGVGLGGLLVYRSGDLSVLIFGDGAYSSLLKLTICAVVIQVWNNHTLALLKLQSKSILYSSLTIAKFVIILGLILYGVVLKGEGLEAIWEANLIGEIVVLALLLPCILKNINWNFNTTIFKEMLSYAFPLILATISGVLLTTIDKFMLGSMTGMENTGVYSLGVRIANTLPLLITTSLSNALLPLRMKKFNEANNERFFSKLNTYTAFVFIIGLLALCLFSLEILKLFTGASIYWEANNIIPIISFAFFFGLLKDNVIYGLHAVKKSNVIGVIFILVAILNIALNYCIIPIVGAYGAALTSLLSQVVFCFIVVKITGRYYPIDYEWKKIGTLFIVSCTIIAVSLAISNCDALIRIPIKLVLLFSFPFILHLFKFYEEVELQTLKNMVSTWKDRKKLGDNMKRLLK